MIILNNKDYEINSAFPSNIDWRNEGNIVIDENTEDGKLLCEKVIQHAPYFNFVLDANGNLIDITPTERPAPPTPAPTQAELLQQDVGQLLLESASDKAKIADLESLTGALLLEIAALKGGVA